MPTRRTFVKAGVATGAVAAIGAPRLLTGTADAAVIDPATIPKYQVPLFVLPAMPRQTSSAARDEYSIAARQFTQQILPPGMPRTTVWGMGSTTSQMSFHAPAFTIEARVNKQVRVTWRNELRASNGNFLPPLTTVDPTLHWANPPGGVAGRDSEPTFTSTPPPYRGPSPFIVHLHGERSFEESDGYPEAWFLPNANNIPNGYARVGSFYDRFKQEARDRWGVNWPTGGAIFNYPNDQPAGACWYHDHSLGMTRNNVYSGLAGMYLLRGGSRDLPAGVLPGPAPQVGDPSGRRYYEIPLILQSKTFNSDGSLFFPASRAEFGDVPANGPFIPQSDIPPYWNPTFVANAITVNGNTWPFLNVEPRRYRFRLLNASNIRDFNLKVVSDPLAPRPAPAALPIWVIGSDVGFFASPAQVANLPIFTAERYDIIIDFTGLAPGTTLFLSNEGGNTDPATTGQVLRFNVVPLQGTDTSTPPAQLSLPGFPIPPPSTVTRRLSLQQINSTFFTNPPIPARFSLGVVNANGTSTPLRWDAPLTENPGFNVSETWELTNFTQGGHLIHIHLIQFQVVNRQPVGGAVQQPAAHERGPKDTILVPGPAAAGQPPVITRVRMLFDRRSLYVWHCHFIDHEDHEMMRPFQVV